MKYAIDKIENNVALLENIKDGSKKEIDIKMLPLNVKETDILSYDGKVYLVDNNEKEKRIKIIREKMEKLRRR
ncbi:MAG TPA: DUF3006 domain-containing protein [Candidatus Aphodocola excrementigallinarum]|uniref:DUF3006 domain-containing protein n=1 Tax=Candidatus Aphodocola excrementigallinarum TaxID=2840670 RepID=A0A9D1LH21_9FIRM|nr:DUF3006 domain-containing protein [Candidatus Aphodocola excrementigallinarum]